MKALMINNRQGWRPSASFSKQNDESLYIAIQAFQRIANNVLRTLQIS